MPDNIHEREITAELRESYLDYAMSVIVARALPDVRDGLKPVQRRILWAMWDDSLTHTAKFRKSANVVGTVLGRYHPHGDMAVYDAMARMAQDFSLRYPLVNGQGNWGSIDGDSPAAMRYCVTGDTLVVTERGLVPIQELTDIEDKQESVTILSKDRKLHKAVKWFASGTHPTIKISTHKGFSVQGTANHPILTWTEDPHTGAPSFRWKLLTDIEEGDIAVIDRTADALWPETPLALAGYLPGNMAPRVQIKKVPRILDEDLAHILGALIAEGSITRHKIEFCNSDKAWIAEFKERWARAFPDCRLHEFTRKPSSFGKEEYVRLEIHSQYVIEFLRNLGLQPVKSKEKQIPETILRSPKPVAAAFLAALFEGDGTITWSSRMTELSLISTSERLIQTTQTLLLRFGIVGAKRYDTLRRTHKLYLRSIRNYRLFRHEIGFVSERKNRKLEETLTRLYKEYSHTDYVPFVADFVRNAHTVSKKAKDFLTRYNFDRYEAMAKRREAVTAAVAPVARHEVGTLLEYLLENNYVFDPVVRKGDAGEMPVYSIKVASECHSFVANGFINHNTEARLARVAENLLTDIEKETVDWQPNYDTTREEPKCLPAKLPNLLLNGTMGIAVGMATSVPPHNLNEVADAITHLMDNPEATVSDLMAHIPGPDFPTGGIMYDRKAIEEAYATGKGSIPTRAVAEIEERKSGSYQIIVTEIPYQVNKSELITKIAELAQEKKIEGIRDLRDESDRDGLRIVVELKTDAAPQKVLNQLYQYTDLQKNIHLNMIALVGGIQPRLLSLKEILEEYIGHRKVVIRRRTEYDLKKAKERAHILEGLVKALDVIDRVIATIKKSKDRDDAKVNLIKIFKFTELQAHAILEMRLSTLAALEREKLEAELKEKRAQIAELELILKHPKKILDIIRQELGELKKTFGDARRTKIVKGGLKEFREEDLVPQEEVVLTLSRDGYIKRMPPTVFRAQKRGGKGLIGLELKEEDQIGHLLAADTHDNILFFTDRGKVFQTKVYEVPAATRTAKGKPIVNFLEIPQGDRVNAVVAYSNDEAKEGFLMMVTKHGLVKKTALEDFENVRRTGIIAITLKPGDALRTVTLSSGNDEAILVSAGGQSIRFKEKDVRPMGRGASGVTGVRLKKGDEVVALDIIRKGEAKDRRILVVMAHGFGKQTPLKEYKVQNRGGSGIRTARITGKTGPIIAAHIVSDESEEIIAFSTKGQAIKTGLKAIRMAGRDTQGVKIMNLNSGDTLVGIVCL